mgnify:CR=1 FL=1
MSEERKTIYLCLAHMSDEGYEQKYVKEAFDTNWVVPMGPNVNAFEEDLRKFVTGNVESAVYQDSRWPEATAAAWNLNPALKDTKVVCLSAGTAAVHLALLACGVGPGDEVCVQSFTFCASSHPITYLGATPVFIDSEAETWNMDPELLEKAILDRKEKTGKYPKAIVPVALYGMPYKIDEIMAIANKYDADIRYCSIRKEIKDHGDKGILLGSPINDGDKVVIIEDVTTAGTSIQETLPIVKAQGDVDVLGLVVSVDRMERGQGEKSALMEIEENYGLKTTAIVTMAEVVEHLYNKPYKGKVVIDDTLKAAIDAYYEQYGVK